MDELKQILENAGMSEGAGGPHRIEPMMAAGARRGG